MTGMASSRGTHFSYCDDDVDASGKYPGKYSHNDHLFWCMFYPEDDLGAEFIKFGTTVHQYRSARSAV